MANEHQTEEKKADLPPGTILGPDGKPCKTCMSSSAFSGLVKLAKLSRASDNKEKTADAPKRTKPDSEIEYERSCPASVEILGRHTWTFLHTAAAYYPEKPSQAHQSSMLGLLQSLPTLYPCSHCASELKEEMKDLPPGPAVQNRQSLSLWMCQIHNKVNDRLGKEPFDCTQVDIRWRDGPANGFCD